MSRPIDLDDLNKNTFFWMFFISWFRGYDNENEINIDEALEVVGVEKEKFEEWESSFFLEHAINEAILISAQLKNEISFEIRLETEEISFFINGMYIGNLGGHFESWFLTWDELMAFDQGDTLFLLLLPMVGIENHQIEMAKRLITEHLKSIPMFDTHAGYIAQCIVNGLEIEGKFYHINGVGTVNDQNHCVRNLTKYPDYKDGVTALNAALKINLHYGTAPKAAD